MASRSMFPTAGRLLRGLAYMLHSCHSGGLITIHVPGVENVMADIASRPAKARAMFAPAASHLSDDEFRSSFDTAFPLPNNQVWKLVHVPDWLKYNVFETLRGKRLGLQQWAKPSEQGTGKRGSGTATSIKPTVGASLPQTPPTCSSLLLLPCGKVSTDSGIKSRFSQCPRLSEPSDKSMFWTDMQTLENPLLPSNPSTSP